MRRCRSVGSVEIYAFGSTPCLSFLAALAQLKRQYPEIVLKIGFDEDIARMPKVPSPSTFGVVARI